MVVNSKSKICLLTQYAKEHPVVSADFSIQAAAEFIRSNGYYFVPVVVGEKYIGVFTELDVLHSLNHHLNPSTPIRQILDSNKPAPVYPDTPIKEVFSRLGRELLPYVVLCDYNDHYLGIISASHLLAGKTSEIRPRCISGITTPFGIYLSDGNLSSGSTDLGMVVSGFIYLFSILISLNVSYILLKSIYHLNIIRDIYYVDSLYIPLALLMILFSIKFSSLSKIHCVQHMSSKVIESGDVIRMESFYNTSRKFSSCRANYFVLVFFIFSFYNLHIADQLFWNIMFSLSAGICLNYVLKDFIHQYFLVSKPSYQQVRRGLRVCTDILEQYQFYPSVESNFINRFRLSGAPYLLLGSGICYLLLFIMKLILNWDIIL